MKNNLFRLSGTKAALALATAASLLGLVFFTVPVGADVDPRSCTDNGGGISLGAFRSDGVTSIGAADNVVDGEAIKYKATLSALAAPNCAFQGGTWSLTTPDGVVHALGAVPKIGGLGVASLTSSPVDYTVVHANEVALVITATTNYGGGISHATPGDTTPGPVLQASKQITVIHPSTVTSITSSSPTVVFGGSVSLTVTEQNNGDAALTSPSVVVDNGVGTLTAPPTSGDTGGDGILGAGETWVWTVSSGVINSNTTFTATGHGTDSLGSDITWCADPQAPPQGARCDQEEQDAVLVTVVQPLQVVKTATTTYDQLWTWTIDKRADQTNLNLADGELFTVHYDVSVNSSSSVINATVSGTITITNPGGNPTANITNVTDALSIGGSATVTCPGGLSQTLAAGASLVCTYSKNLGAANTDQTNTATVTTSGSVPGNSSNVAVVDFTSPANIIDECIDVSDTNVGVLGTVCSGDAPYVYHYSKTFGKDTTPPADVPLVCGQNSHLNTASFITNDTQTRGSDDWTVNANVNCFVGCTLTQGYWKTHNNSFKGGAPTDDNWNNITPLAELSGFFTTVNSYPVAGLNIITAPFTWFSVFQTSPAGNAYYNLAHQYMAAKLNILNGAAAPASVTSAISSAETFFTAYTPAAFNSLGKKSPVRAQVIGWATTLGSFNEGLIGPGHCDEQNPI